MKKIGIVGAKEAFQSRPGSQPVVCLACIELVRHALAD
jgi:hypothetical protein